ncbi:class II aldolase/adducin family protein [Thermithiobacillus plumbiphilus]|uniref:Class II aldolase/adducin family protein n=1 Tax=Thermithiobacillus plumbiphilus TaxID=1729899 RepID=A0ABU9D9R8_9PROT
MPQPEDGVIKFELDFEPGPALPASLLCELNDWRQRLFAAGLIGQDAARYGGVGYGNVSMRLPPVHAPMPGAFVVSGTQTGGLPVLTPEHYALVLACQPARNYIRATGPIAPSSEAMTHGMFYAVNDTLQFVMHGHSPLIWGRAADLGIPVTRADVPYGTPAMAEEIARLYADPAARGRGIFAMGGHEDGVIAFAERAAEAGGTLLDSLAAARRLTMRDE